MRPARALGAVAALALAAVPGDADAQGRVVLDQATLEPSPVYGQARLRLFASAVDLLTGNVVPIDGPTAWKLEVNGSDKRIPYFVTTYDGGQYLTAVAIVIETTAEYAADLPVLAPILDDELLAKLPALTTQAIVIGYADKPTAAPKWSPAKTAAGKLKTLTATTEATEPALLDAVDRALGALRKLKTDPEGQPVRKLLVVVSDGRDRADDRSRTTSIGKRAAKDGIRIHALAYSPSDTRRPLLALGELSRRSLGTFRWVRKIGTLPVEQSFREQVKNLRAEIDRQYVLTYFVPAEDVAGKKLSLTADLRGKSLASLAVKAPAEARCGGLTCATDGYCVNARCVSRGTGGGRGVLGWILLIGGIAVGAIVGLGFIGFLLARRTERLARRAALAAAAGLTSNPPGSVAPFVPGSVPPAPGPASDGVIRGVPLPGFQSQPPPGVAPVEDGAPRVQAIQAIVAGQTTAAQPHAAAQATLYVMAGALAGQRLPLRHGFVIGKDPACDLRIDDGYTSSHHAMILMDARGNCSLQDRGSTNGTFVNGVRVAEPVPLAHGTTIRIGSTDLRFLAQ
jgi:hypothetical protein